MAREDRSRRRNTYPPEGVDAKSANIARVYAAFLGGKDNFAADRQVVEAALRVAPDASAGSLANRAFLRRVVRYLVRDAGITQILDAPEPPHLRRPVLQLMLRQNPLQLLHDVVVAEYRDGELLARHSLRGPIDIAGKTVQERRLDLFLAVQIRRKCRAAGEDGCTQCSDEDPFHYGVHLAPTMTPRPICAPEGAAYSS